MRAWLWSFSWLAIAACAGTPLRPGAFDESKGVARVQLTPATTSDRLMLRRGLALVAVLDASGQRVLGTGASDAHGRCSVRMFELNPGRYTLEVARCGERCVGGVRSFALPFEARAGHRYRVELRGIELLEGTYDGAFKAVLQDETTGATIGSSARPGSCPEGS